MPLNNVVVNGDFETGSLTPWLSANTSINSTFSHSGFFSAQLAGGGLNSFISQFVPITAGNNLELLFSLAKIGALPSPTVSTSIAYYDAVFNFLGFGLIVNNISSRIPDVTTNDTWLELYNATSPAPAGTTQALITIDALPQAGTANILVDDIEALLVTGPAGSISVNRIYVANFNFDVVTVIDGATNTVITQIPVGVNPFRVGVNPLTNRIYVSNFTGNSVSVIDGVTNTVIATVPVGTTPGEVGVNTFTNAIYVPNRDTDNVSVIGGLTNTVIATIPVGNNPNGVGANPLTNRIYVTNQDDNNFSVIDGVTNAVIANVPVGARPFAIGVNP